MRALIFSFFFSTLAIVGCAAEEPLEGDGRMTANSTAGFGNANPAGQAGSFGNPDDPTAGSGFAGTGQLPVAGTSGECGGENHSAEGKPLDIYIIMDESVSMILPVDIWGPTSMALNQFFSSTDHSLHG